MIRVAVDWGSSSFRAYLFDSSGELLDTFSDESGIKFIKHKEFEAALTQRIGQWLSPGDTVLLSGMITSRNGWIESGYIPCPANLDQLLIHSQKHRLNQFECVFLPGVSQSNPPDVIRGEELQMLGASAQDSNHVFVIPGTHSKWASVSNRVINRFSTIPTGELFDVIVRHTLLGELTSSSEESDAFEKGVIHGYQSKALLNDLFTTRSSVLMEQATGGQAREWLSGLLIGNEISEGLTLIKADGVTPELIGSERLCGKYLTAFKHLGFEVRLASPDATVSGYQEIIRFGQM